jgi:putative FmdB family regulatory protein
VPIYEYECEACGHRFELIRKYSDLPVELCPVCGERKVHKRVSSPAFQFKGTGWYVTDYARKGTGNAEAQEKAASQDGKDSNDAKDAKDVKDTKDRKDTKDAKETKAAKSAPSDSGTPASSSGSTGTAPATPSSKDS